MPNFSYFSVNPYKILVSALLSKSFKEIEKGNADFLLNLLSDKVRYQFEGEHVLGKTCNSKAEVRLWFAHFFRLFSSKFTLHTMTITGPIWNTTVVTEFTDQVTPAYGPSYSNDGIQICKLRWGKAVSIRTYVSTDKVIKALDIMYQHGINEAKLTP